MRTGAKHRVTLWTAAAAIAVPGAVLLFPPAGQAAPLPDECDDADPSQIVCTYDAPVPAGTEFVVPTGVEEITVAAQGAAGESGPTGSAGGAGAIATKTFSVDPGDSFELEVVSGGSSAGLGGAGGGAALFTDSSATPSVVLAGGGGGGGGDDGDGGDAGLPSSGFPEGGAGGSNDPSGGGGGQSFALGFDAPADFTPTDDTSASISITFAACEPAQGVSVGNASVLEGDPGDVTVLQFEVAIAEPSDCATTQVSLASEDVDATAGNDYEAADLLAFFAPGDEAVAVNVEVTADDVEEMDEQLLLRVTEVEISGTTLDGAVTDVTDDLAIGTILDDDAAEPEPEPVTPDEICDPANAPDGYSQVVGGPDDEVLNGGSGKQIVYGDDGNDVLNGGGGKDILCGGDGDILNGGGGKDQLYGQGDTDMLNGGSGKDVAVQ